ncbi:sulfotransferase [Oceanicoccus sp. KOV_DT_Chl]|uniref:tetratricopeptide repeat-containing sulfotransferase family protein n=1 Tax=Oceanicoccus sp. KOV_DT_Chl TaxID=1904639 RepID=UPI00135C1A9F|nr:sulfotransferase [Oceanicoccus sp. KOV_DT_Chl]
MSYTKEQLFSLAVSAIDAGDMRSAINACREMNSQYPDFHQGWRIACELHLRLNNPKSGLAAINRSLSFQPNDAEDLLKKAECLMGLAEVEAALNIINQVVKYDYKQSHIFSLAGLLFSRLDQHELSLEQYRRALALDPENPTVHYNIGSELRFLGRIAESEVSLNQSLKGRPLDAETLAMRSSLRKQTPDNNHVEALTTVLASPELHDGDQPYIYYALAKEKDDLGDHAASFDYLKRGADKRRSQMAYQPETDLEIIAAIQETFNKQLLMADSAGCSSDEPIFIIGMPRTGTTLVERILGSHSEVYAAGELDSFGREMMRLAVDSNGGEKFQVRQDLIQATTHLNFKLLGERYVQATRPFTGHTSRFIDKLPFNYLYAGLIHLALPNAKIINLKRNPMDTCYAVYKQLFRDVYPFSYNLEELGRYYVAYHQLMEHWNKVIPGVIYTVNYEDVVADTEGEARKLLDYCGLEWQQQCLRFYENKQASTTASATQVRQPIYKSSVAKWRLYEEQLKPLSDIILAAGIEIG